MDFPQRSHRPMTHYILEFAAVLLGISASLYAENIQELQRNERIKNQSLTRIQRNIEQDIADTDFNIHLIKMHILLQVGAGQRQTQLGIGASRFSGETLRASASKRDAVC